MTLARRGRACQRASTLTVAATLRLAPSWSLRHSKARRKTHPLNFRSTRYRWMAYFFGGKRKRGDGLDTTRIMLRYHENPWYRGAAGAWVDEVAGRSFDVCDWFSYPASATYRDTHARVKSKPRWRPLKEIYFDVPWPHSRWTEIRSNMNRSWIEQ